MSDTSTIAPRKEYIYPFFRKDELRETLQTLNAELALVNIIAA